MTNSPSSESILQKSDAGQRGELGIVIVNWNSGQFLRQCLESISRCEDRHRIQQVVVVDNDSHDGSCQNLPSLPVPFRLIQNKSNLGFAVACNQGAAVCDSMYLLFLNPDSQLSANSLRVPLAYLDDPLKSDVGICGIQLIDERGRIGRTCSRLPTCSSLVAMATRMHSLLPRIFPPHFMKEWDHRDTREVEQVIGAFFFVRQDLFLQLKGFDERFFVYYEEVDFCQRARSAGYRTMFLASAQADHAGGGCSNQIRGRALFYSLRSRVLYAKKHFSSSQSLAVGIATFLFEPLIRAVTMIFGLKLKNLPQLMYGFSLLWWDHFVEPISPGASVASTQEKMSEIHPEETSLAPQHQQQTRSAA